MGKGSEIPKESGKEGRPSASQDRSPQGGNPFEALVAGLLAKGIGKGGSVPQGGAPQGFPSAGQDGQQQVNPFKALVGGLLGKGLGKGGGIPQGGAPEGSPSACQPGSMQGGNPLEALLGNVLGGGNVQANAGNSVQNPLGLLIGAALSAAGKGKGKGAPGCAQGEGDIPQGNHGGLPQGAGAGKGNGSCPFAEACSVDPAPEPQAPVSEAASTSRAQFEESVTDLVNMGLASDPQVARELLTKHGDVSTVVSNLMEA
jgi:hypothetical protein